MDTQRKQFMTENNILPLNQTRILEKTYPPLTTPVVHSITKRSTTGNVPNKVGVFTACYANTPVFELVCNGVGVMRRQIDGWINITQILKVAGIEKGFEFDSKAKYCFLS